VSFKTSEIPILFRFLVLPGNFSHQIHAVGLGFLEKKIPRITVGTARIGVTWFSQYSCLKIQNIAIIGQLWQTIFPDFCMRLA
jgi:hypothetical protein